MNYINLNLETISNILDCIQHMLLLSFSEVNYFFYSPQRKRILIE